MLSRFSSLFTYVVVGLVVSAAATPLNPLGDSFGGGGKSLSRPRPMMKSFDKGKPYGDDKAKPYGDNDEHYDNDKGKHQGQCSTEKQQCCNQVNEATETSKLESMTNSILGLAGVINIIKDSNKLWGFDCSPLLFNKPCNNQQVCCDDSHVNGLIAVSCNNFNII